MLGELLKKLRLRPLEGEGERPEGNVDALATHVVDSAGDGWAGASAPTNWVPSQQDERPRH
jgi:hypothetical protein